MLFAKPKASREPSLESAGAAVARASSILGSHISKGVERESGRSLKRIFKRKSLREMFGRREMVSTGAPVDPGLVPRGVTAHCSNDVWAIARSAVLERKIAPFEDGIDSDATPVDSSCVHNCTICCLDFFALNRTRCCGVDICSNCYFRVKTEKYVRDQETPKKLCHLLLAHCPFCKSKPFEVVFTGGESIEERRRAQEETGASTSCTSTRSIAGTTTCEWQGERHVLGIGPGEKQDRQREAVDRLLLNQAVWESINRKEQQDVGAVDDSIAACGTMTGGTDTFPSTGSFDLLNPFKKVSFT